MTLEDWNGEKFIRKWNFCVVKRISILKCLMLSSVVYCVGCGYCIVVCYMDVEFCDVYVVIRGSILADVQSGSQTKLTTSKSVVILGNCILCIEIT